MAKDNRCKVTGFSPIVKRSGLTLLLVFLLTARINAQVPLTTAVDFTVKDLNSNTHHLFDYLDANKIVVIDFFTTSCGPCQTYATQISDAYDYFGCNQGNVVFLGMNWGSDNNAVRIFDSVWDARYPAISGLQGGGNGVTENYEVQSYPTVIVITPDKNIATNYIWPPAFDSVVNKVTDAGGVPMPCTVSTIYHQTGKTAQVTNSGNSLRIALPDDYRYDVALYSLEGKKLLNRTLSGTREHFIPHSLKRGIYFVVVNTEGRTPQILKIII